MATFQEWWDENYGEFSGQSVQSKIKMRMAYDVGVEHQLTKVDEQQKQIDELNQENQKLVLSNTGYHNASASYLCKLMQIQFVLNQQTEIAKSKRTDGEVFEDKTETKIADYLDDYNIALDKILGDEATQEQFNAYAKGNEFLKQKARADKNQKQIDELQTRIQASKAKWISVASILATIESNVPDVIYKQLDELHDALCGLESE